jgi:hypothetical protein
MSHRPQVGPRFAGVAHLHTEMVRTVIADRLHEADEYRAGHAARAATQARDPNRFRDLLARLVPGKRVGRPEDAGRPAPRGLPPIPRGSARDRGSQS